MFRNLLGIIRLVKKNHTISVEIIAFMQPRFSCSETGDFFFVSMCMVDGLVLLKHKLIYKLSSER